MKQVSEMPKSGQFVAVWVEDNQVKSESFIADGDVLCLAKMPELKFQRPEIEFPTQTVYMVI